MFAVWIVNAVSFKIRNVLSLQPSSGIHRLVCILNTLLENPRTFFQITYSSLSKRWSVDTLPSLVKFRHDHVLCLVGTGLGREVENVWFVDLLVQFVQQEILLK